MTQSILELEDLHVSYFSPRGEVKAVDGISLNVNRGEVFGIAGESGCGKSTMAYAILRLIKPPGRIVDGKILVDGTDVLRLNENELRSYRWKKVSMVFQNAMNSLNPVQRVGSQIAEAILTHENTSRSEVSKRVEELLTLVGMERTRVKDYPHQLSGGMRQRVVIAMALALDPALLIADEPTTALDVVVQRQVLEVLMDMQRQLNLSLILITHNISTLHEFSDRIAIMYAGKLMELADANRLFTSPLHPYSKGLIRSLMGFVHRGERLWFIPGSPPDLATPMKGCRFQSRCPERTDRCEWDTPNLVEVEPGHYVACNNTS